MSMSLTSLSNCKEMANFSKINGLISLLSNLSIKKPTAIRCFSSTTSRSGLMEFFDDEKNWGVEEVKCGRSWKADELRLKSNTDLHKLWYVLLKERNMLLTMEHEAKSKIKIFPSPERLDKVEESMENLETVVRERNVAYHELETGETGERPKRVEVGRLGLKYCYKMHEYPVPKHMNKKWHEKGMFYRYDRDVEEFLLKYREKLYLRKRRKQNRDFNHVIKLMNRFPNMDMEALKAQFPDVDVEKAKNSRKYKPMPE